MPLAIDLLTSGKSQCRTLALLELEKVLMLLLAAVDESLLEYFPDINLLEG